MPHFEHGADGIDRRRRTRPEPAQLAVLYEEEKSEEMRVLIMSETEPSNHCRQLCVRAGLGPGEGVEAAGERDVVALEDVPHEFFLADEMAIEGALRDIDRAGDVSHAGLRDALLDEQPDRGLLDAFARVRESMSWHLSGVSRLRLIN